MRISADPTECNVGQDRRLDGSRAGVEKIVDKVSAALCREVIDDELKLAILRAIAWAERANINLLGDGIDGGRWKANAGKRVISPAQDVRRWHNQSGGKSGRGSVADVCACAHSFLL